ncbi:MULTISPECIES: hypothetical protein [unclassified Acinetobacter]|uniref:hypothetical protein n=1 Tax=unclassified Acinetobacter TaxID=196816 RepID=UPI0015D31926|nr:MULTISPECIES: hypothetical protein [unclassified Acinetobacter]
MTLITCTAAQANLFDRTDFILEDRVISLPTQESYTIESNRIKTEEAVLASSISTAETLEAKTKLVCEIVDHKFERFGLASANLKHPEAKKDYSQLKQELEYDIKMLAIGSMSCNI